MLVGVALSASVAAAKPAPTASTGEVVVTVARRLGEVAIEGEPWQVVETGGDGAWWMRCPRDVEEVRRVALRIEGDAVLREEGAWPAVRRLDAGRWFAPATGTDARWWLVDVRCRIVRPERSTAPEAFDHLEFRRGSVEALVTDATVSDLRSDRPALRQELEGVDLDEAWRTWVLRRPAGGAVPVVGGVRGTRRDPWWHHGDPAPWAVDDVDTLRVRGGARVRVAARVDPAREEACLRVDDGQPSCIPVRAARTLVGDPQAGLVVAPEAAAHGRPLDVASRSRVARWDVWLPKGDHTFALPGGGWIGGTRLDVDRLARIAPLPTLVDVRPDPPRDAGAEAPWVSATMLGPTAPSAIFLGPVVRRADAGEGRVWVALRDAPALGAPPDEVLLRLLPGDDASGACRLDDGQDGVWVAARPTSSVLVRRVVRGASWPSVRGCDAWVAWEGSVPAGVAQRSARVQDVLLPGGWRELELPKAPAGVSSLRVAVGDEPVEVRWRDASGVEGGTLLATVRGEGSWVPADGGGAVSMVDLPVVTTSSRLWVTVSAPTSVRWRAPSVEGDAADAAAAPPPLPSVATTPAVDSVTLAGSIAREDDAVARRDLLLARAAGRLAAGDPRGARRDVALAGGDPALESAIGRSIADALRSVLDVAWSPTGNAWVLERDLADAGALLDALRAAEDADYASLARWMTGPSQAVAWARAGRTQILDASQAIEAFRAVSLDPALAADPALGSARAWSRWTSVPGLTGTSGATLVMEARLASSEGADPVVFPEVWDPAARLDLSGGLAWPASVPVKLPVRCLAREPAALSSCVVRRVDAQGHVLARATLDPWGLTTTVDWPAMPASTTLEVRASGDVVAEVAWPAEVPRPSPARSVRVLSEGGMAQARLVGPTVLRAMLWDASVQPASLCLGGSTGCVAFGPPDGEGVRTALAAWPSTAPVDVQVVAWPGARITLSRREPVPAGLEPGLHVALLEEAPPGRPGGSPPEPAGVLQASVAVPPMMPRPIAAWGAVAVDLGSPDEDLEAIAVALRVLSSAGVSSRPWTAPVWLESTVGAWAAPNTPTVGRWTAGAETWQTWGPSRLWARADLDTRFGGTAGGIPFAFRGTAEVGAAYRVDAWLDLRGSLTVDGAARAGTWTAASRDVTPTVLWSGYREAHPFVGALRGELRLWPSPWIRSRIWGRAVSNAPGDPQPLDAASGGLDVRFALPGVRMLAGVGVEHRPSDDDRTTAWTSPTLHAEAEGMVWTRSRVAVLLGGEVDAVTAFRRVTAALRLQVLWNGRPGLADLRPRTVDAREGLAWREPGRFLPLDPAPP
jgi:hypothetical protein